MADNAPHRYLICYDISDPKRLSQVHRVVRREGVPLQYSVFVTEMRKAEIVDLLARLSERIDPRVDDVRAYCLPERCETVMIGTPILPADVMMMLGGAGWPVGGSSCPDAAEGVI